jgi:hypothetical protein
MIHTLYQLGVAFMFLLAIAAYRLGRAWIDPFRTCRRCEGNGVSGSGKTCRRCKGRGEVRRLEARWTLRAHLALVRAIEERRQFR